MIEDGSGRVYLMDFGIAKQGGSAAERGLTQAGVFVGTRRLRGAGADPRRRRSAPPRTSTRSAASSSSA